MSMEALFGLSVLLSFVASGIVARLYIVPWLRGRAREDALLPLLMPHLFRFVGLSFLVPGVVSASLSGAFAAPTAYGDLGATLLALISVIALVARASWALAIVWIFNVWGTCDLLYAFYTGLIAIGGNPGVLGAAFYIPTVVVPALLVTHVMIFWLLLRPKRQGRK